MTARTFRLGDLLTVTTGCMVAPRLMDAMYDVLNWMTGDNLFTHQLLRATRECAPEILRQHPDLADVAVPDFSAVPKDACQAAVADWLVEQVARFGETRELTPLPTGAHERRDPLTELASMMRPDAQIVVVLDDGGVSQ